MNTEDAKKILEADLYEPIRDLLISQGYTVYSEVLDCDVSAVKGDELVVVELKRHLSVELLAQAAKRQRTADTVYVAIPKPKRMKLTSKWKDTFHLLRRLELGLIMVSFRKDTPFVEVALEPGHYDGKPSKSRNKTKRNRMMTEIAGRHGDFNIGGTTGRKLVTAYREKAIFIACCLERFGSSTPKKLRENGTDPKKTTAILYENHYGWFERIDRGLYALTEAGREDLKLYPNLTAYYYDNIGAGDPEVEE